MWEADSSVNIMQERWDEGFFFGKEVQVFFVYDYKDNIKKIQQNKNKGRN